MPKEIVLPKQHSMNTIKKLKLYNFKRFKTLTVDFDDKLNVFIGDNESGKSTILTAINLVLSGSKSKIEGIGLESLFNADAIASFLASNKEYSQLPKLYAELYLSDQNNPDLNGKNNSDVKQCDGLRLEIEPNEEFFKETIDVLAHQDSIFPFEYYSIKFNTFQGDGYTGYRRFIKHVILDSSLVSSDYAIREYINNMYSINATSIEKHHHQNAYRKLKESFTNTVLSEINSRLEGDYSFAIRHNAKANMETDLSLTENKIHIDNKGQGKQCFVKTEFALNKTHKNLEVILIEEPENHLSHLNMKRLIQKIGGSTDKQLFITTHSNMISARLNLRHCILINSNSDKPAKLSSLTAGTAEFFVKASNNNILDFILSKKVLLVEGDAEYMLMESFFRKAANKELSEQGVHIISVNGTSFKRYLEVAGQLNIKTAVIRDNDGNYEATCVERYQNYTDSRRRIFAETDDSISTFEISIYQHNQRICDDLFGKDRRSLSVQDYMLADKAEAAFALLTQNQIDIAIPQYIIEAIKWISE